MLIAIPKVNKSFSVDLDQERSGGNKAQVLNAVFPDHTIIFSLPIIPIGVSVPNLTLLLKIYKSCHYFKRVFKGTS